MATIVLDAGHGGHDPGATLGTRRESDDALRMVLAVGRILENCGHRVVYTRRTDVFIPLSERARISNNAGANIFVSIHRNGSTNSAAEGTDNFVRVAATQREVDFATRVLNRVLALNVFRNRGIQRANFTVLTQTNAPAQLLELGFITNPLDNARFDANFDRIATAVATGIMDNVGPCRGTPTTPPPVVTPPPVTPPPPPPTTDDRAVIRQIQTRLNQQFGQHLAVDGIAGPLTRRALTRALQMVLNTEFACRPLLAVDGIFGPLTRGCVPLVRAGMRGNIVWVLQSAMFIHGFRTNPDGIFGPLTNQTVRNFQSSRGLGIDGIAGPITFTELFRSPPFP
ncbi:MAG: N-acetylmuramoyl-L-alanine amidase [Firmicutes bacterium]|nr:N-acetylmuramoyl-L-alanine amidase [Bacillota bacterium]